MQEKLKLPRTLGKKGSKYPVIFSSKDLEDFEEMKRRLGENLRLKIPNPGKPFVIRTDASNQAVGGSLEQMDDDQPLPPPGSEEKIRTYPVAFFSRKLTSSQIRTWPVREKEAYAVVSILKKYASLIGLQPVLILTDHKSLENWATEVLDAPGGPTGRRARWHILLSRFKIDVRYVKGETNIVADALSRWAYPAGEGQDSGFNGTEEDEYKMARLIEQEKAEEAECAQIFGVEPRQFCCVHLDWNETTKNSTEIPVANVINLNHTPKALDLFSGQGSWRDAFTQMGYEVTTMDWDPKNKADIQRDILTWKYWLDISPGQFEVVSASVPCEEYSQAKTIGRRNIKRSNRITARVLEIIRYLKPQKWFLENPRFGLLKSQRCMRGIKYVDVDYCQFSDYGYKKPTRIWGPPQICELQHVLCDPPTCPHCYKQDGRWRHRQWLGGTKTHPGTKLKWRVPRKLIEYLMTMPATEKNDPGIQVAPLQGESEGGSPPLRFHFATPPEDAVTQPRLTAYPSTPEETPSGRRTRDPSLAPRGPCVGEPCVGDASRMEPRHGSVAAPSIPPPPGTKPGGVYWQNWPNAYTMCPKFATEWGQVCAGGANWPKGFQRHGDHLFFETKLCIPTSLLPQVIHELHVASGHMAHQKLFLEVLRRFTVPGRTRAQQLAREVSQKCEICQANEHRHVNGKFPMQPTPIPPVPMDNIAIDVFLMKPTKFEGHQYDCMVVIVERHSGWVTAFPEKREGLTAKRVARQCLLHHWDLFGIPRVVVSDQGPQFAANFWRTLCSHFGVTNTFCQAGHHRANGRAEVAGKILKNFMRKIQTTRPEWNWVEILPAALKHLRTTPGESGLSPYQIILGREPLRAGIPIPPECECEDATSFVLRLQKQDQEVARLINDQHKKDFDTINDRLRNPAPLAVGDKVWVLRPRGLSADKLRSWWIGPCPVKGRVGENSYQIEVKPGRIIPVHRSQMKEHWDDPTAGEKLSLFHFSPEVEDFETGPEEWEVEKILKHRMNPRGKLEFLVKWKDWPEKTWEPVMHFIHRYSRDWRDYVVAHKLRFNIVDYMDH